MKKLNRISFGVSMLALSLAGCTDHDDHGGHNDSHREDEHDEHGHDEHEVHGDHGSERVVRISVDAIKRSGIEIAIVKAVPRTGGIDAPAEIQAEADREAHISSVVSGQIARVSVSVGDRVKSGQALGVIRSVALGEARAQAAHARANVEVAKSNFRRQEELRREGIGAQRQFLEAEAELRRAQAEQSAADRALDVYGHGGSGSEVTLRSPINGRVVSRHATVGEVVAPGDVLFEVTDIAKVWVVGRVYQKQAAQVREGAPAVVALQSHPGRTFEGKLDYVAPALDERTRTLPVRMTLDNPDGALRPGSFGTLSISPKAGDDEAIPAVVTSALQRLGDETVVFVPGDQEGEFRAVTVGVASRSKGIAQLSKGLKAGDRYVGNGAFVLKSELSRGELGEGHAH